VALTPAFAQDPMKKTQWTAFLRKSGAADGPRDLPTAVQAVAAFVSEPLLVAPTAAPWAARWMPGGPWRRA
jgi:hypothetical protein